MLTLQLALLFAAAADPHPVWTGRGASHLGSPSPDGRFLSGIQPETGELLLRDFNSGIRRRIGRKAQPYEFASFSVFSPDSKLIAYAWSNAQRHYELRIASVDSLAERTLLVNEGSGLVQPCAFSPDSKQILALVVRPAGGVQVGLVSVETGAVKILKSYDGPKPSRADWSPDGRQIVFANTLLAADGSHEERLVEGFSGDLSPVFSRDGRRVFFSAESRGSTGLFIMPLTGDRRPTLVRSGLGRVLLQGVTADGRLFYALRPGAGNTYRAGFDPVAGKLLSPIELAGRQDATTDDWAHAFPAAMSGPAPSGNFLPRGKELWRVGADAPLATFPRAITALAVAPDGETVAVAQSTTLTLISPKGRQESRAASETISGLVWANDGRHLITVQNDSLWWWSAALEVGSRLVKAHGNIGIVSLGPRGATIEFTTGRPRGEVWSIAPDAR